MKKSYDNMINYALTANKSKGIAKLALNYKKSLQKRVFKLSTHYKNKKQFTVNAHLCENHISTVPLFVQL
jgi:hypothetical protein